MTNKFFFRFQEVLLTGEDLSPFSIRAFATQSFIQITMLNILKERLTDNRQSWTSDYQSCFTFQGRKVKGKIYKRIIKLISTVQYESECWAKKKIDERRFYAAEMRMHRWIYGVIIRDGQCTELIYCCFLTKI